MPKWSYKVKELITEQLEMVARNTVQDLAKQTQDTYVRTLSNWFKDFTSWKKSRPRRGRKKKIGHGFDFLLKASDHYHNGSKYKATRINGDRYAYHCGITVDPKLLDVTLKQRWGENRGIFPNDKAFDLMYMHGVYGFNEDIVRLCWYDNLETTGKASIINGIIDSGMVPPTVDNSRIPFEAMVYNFHNTIGTQRNIRKTMKPYFQKMRQNIEKIGSK